MGNVDDELRERVREIQLDHRGADDAISSREIDDEIDVDSVGSFPATREIVREIVFEDRIPVAASKDGYYVVETEAELAEYLDNLESRITGIAERRFGVLRAAEEWEGDIELSADEDLL